MLIIDETALDLADGNVIASQICSVTDPVQVDITGVARDPGADHGDAVIGADVLGVVVADLLPDELLYIEIIIAHIDLVALGEQDLVVGLIISYPGGDPGQLEDLLAASCLRIIGRTLGGTDLPVGLDRVDQACFRNVGTAVGMAHAAHPADIQPFPLTAVGHQSPGAAPVIHVADDIIITHMAHGLGNRCPSAAGDMGDHLQVGSVQCHQVMGSSIAFGAGRGGFDLHCFRGFALDLVLSDSGCRFQLIFGLVPGKLHGDRVPFELHQVPVLFLGRVVPAKSIPFRVLDRIPAQSHGSIGRIRGRQPRCIQSVRIDCDRDRLLRSLVLVALRHLDGHLRAPVFLI